MLRGEPMVNEEIRSDLTTVRRGTPLPWLLLGVTVFVLIGIFAMARSALNDERLRTANALKANDEVMTRLRTAASEFAKSQLTVTELEAKVTGLEAKLAQSEDKHQALAQELQELKDKAPPKKGGKKTP